MALTMHNEGLSATAVSQTKHRSVQGRKFTEDAILLPGYVFFRTDREIEAQRLRVPDVLRLLTNPEGTWRLTGEDLRFAQMVFEHGGVLGLSKARKVGDRVQIQSGPLKDMEGAIVKIDRHSRNGKVEFRFDNSVLSVWLAFEMVE